MGASTRDWEGVFGTWAGPPSQTEQEQCENATRAIRAAIASSAKLNRRDIKVFIHGSYRNNVNVRQESDIDMGILCRDTFFFDLPEGYTREQLGLNSPASYEYAQYKNEVEEALVNHFERAAVHRGDKAFDVRANTYRVDADVAPFFEYRRYQTSGSYHEGVKLVSDSGKEVINWPEQHYSNGVAKNDATSRAFKGVVRILKKLCIEMEDAGIAAASACPGFLIECMVYNAPNDCFSQQTWKKAVREVLAFLFNNTLDDERCSKWTEISGLKWLFRDTQKWTRQQAHAFIDAAWNYVGLE
ncbi:MAG: nucleotidyltransferase [Nitrospirae bacterium]|nr:nucleotidyltransferase [Nitrospirota bacterium]